MWSIWWKSVDPNDLIVFEGITIEGDPNLGRFGHKQVVFEVVREKAGPGIDFAKGVLFYIKDAKGAWVKRKRVFGRYVEAQIGNKERTFYALNHHRTREIPLKLVSDPVDATRV